MSFVSAFGVISSVASFSFFTFSSRLSFSFLALLDDSADRLKEKRQKLHLSISHSRKNFRAKRFLGSLEWASVTYDYRLMVALNIIDQS